MPSKSTPSADYWVLVDLRTRATERKLDESWGRMKLGVGRRATGGGQLDILGGLKGTCSGISIWGLEKTLHKSGALIMRRGYLEE